MSKTTASDALRGDTRVAAATREKVRAVAERLGFRANPLVKACMSHVRGTRGIRYQATIAVVSTGAEEESFDALIEWEQEFFLGAKQKAEELGFALNLISLSPAHRAENAARVLRTRGIHGLYFLPLRYPIQALPWEDFATVVTGFSIKEPSFDRVIVNFMRLMLLVCSKVAESGYSRPGLAIRREFDHRTDFCCVAGCLYAQRSLERHNRIPPLVYEDEEHPDALLRWYEKHLPDVVLAWDWQIADLLSGHGIRIPQDVGFVALAWNAARPDVAGTDHCRELQGAVAIEQLAGALTRNQRGVPQVPKVVQVDGFWRDGGSLPPLR